MTLLTLDEAKAALNITTTTYDDELQDYIDGAIEAVEFICGPAEAVAVTEVVNVGGPSFALNQTPVISLTSVTGDTYGLRAGADLRVNNDTGVVSVLANRFHLRPDTYTVVYMAGRASVPAAMKQAAKVILKHQWNSQRGVEARQAASADATFVPALGYAVPNAALQMLAPYDLGPGIG